jgi:hypothetical protein
MAKPFTDALEALLDATEFCGVPLPDGQTVADLVALSWVKQILKGDNQALRQALDRVEGRVPNCGEPASDPPVKTYAVGYTPDVLWAHHRPEAQQQPPAESRSPRGDSAVTIQAGTSPKSWPSVAELALRELELCGPASMS